MRRAQLAVQPYHAIDDMRWMEERIAARAENAYTFRGLLNGGAAMSFGSDWPGTDASYYPINPLLGIYAAVTRQTLDGKPAGADRDGGAVHDPGRKNRPRVAAGTLTGRGADPARGF